VTAGMIKYIKTLSLLRVMVRVRVMVDSMASFDETSNLNLLLLFEF
jgi:hypothetical protein